MKISNLKKTYFYFKRNGIKKTLGAVSERLCSPYYKNYFYNKPEEKELERQRKEKRKSCLFSILVPAYETKEEYLRQLIDSVQSQTYPFWQLIIADAGKSDGVKKVCNSYKEDRITYVKLEKNLGISGNTNSALEYVQGDYVGLLDHDDFLTPDALYEMEKAIKEGKDRGKEYTFIYSDEDKCDETGQNFYEPHFKTDFNLDLLLTNNYVCHFLVMKSEEIQKLKLRPTYDGAQDFDLVLRAVGNLMEEKKVPEEMICHIPKVLYHWRCHNDSTAVNPESKKYAYEAGKKALEDFCKERGWQTEVVSLPHVGFYKIIYQGDIFSQREDIAAVGGKEILRGRIINSIFDKEGHSIYQGLRESYSGYFHRAALTQNAEALDITKWKISPKVLEKYETFFKTDASIDCITQEERRKKVCDFLKKEGYRLYWDPDWRIRRKKK